MLHHNGTFVKAAPARYGLEGGEFWVYNEFAARCGGVDHG